MGRRTHLDANDRNERQGERERDRCLSRDPSKAEEDKEDRTRDREERGRDDGVVLRRGRVQRGRDARHEDGPGVARESGEDWGEECKSFVLVDVGL